MQPTRRVSHGWEHLLVPNLQRQRRVFVPKTPELFSTLFSKQGTGLGVKIVTRPPTSFISKGLAEREGFEPSIQVLARITV
jgi:hypothetical protein